MEDRDEMNTTAYLERIGVNVVPKEPNVKALRMLQKRHLLSVPFENLDIHWKRPIILDTNLFFEKIVEKSRGGFCYELNGLFNELLLSLGFRSCLISARVFDGNDYGPEYAHAAIKVAINDDEYLADVGFGDFTTEPLGFSLGSEQHDPNGIFTIRRHDKEFLEVAKRDGKGWKSEYIFQDTPRQLSEFSGMCDFQQYSPSSHFTKGKICSMLTESGRKTLTEKSYIVTAGKDRSETQVAIEPEFLAILKREFGIEQPKV
jgi:N-hydroxyarylamine O-acetyltransferase